MHLVSDIAQEIEVAGEIFRFETGEMLHTENSYKYTIEGFQVLAVRAGFPARAQWVDDAALFSVHYLERA
ncbi:L-histidine N(alpha)-methyltransferase [Salinicola sp. LHM]|uniref:L-histidine N(alpha)-methyltransferase n=1 Tax=Salinicola sp. LHM TaxID=3065298 RepID=UPI002638ED52|nr:L-histidine N(alpha)-methyltransferase [Salinicola sp. LHM]WQH33560.1 L-histidine N(alpha)-methyltransferase [Salinicola sp. LHM]